MEFEFPKFPRRALLTTVVAGLAASPAKRVFGARRYDGFRMVDMTVAGGRISRVTHWRASRRRGTIMFSHGARSSPAKYDRLILPWVAAGYDVWAPLHVDSTDHPDTKAYTGLMSWRARIEDMRSLSLRLGERPRIAAGHSYGALVALTLGGASAVRPTGLAGPLNDALVNAVVAFSPPGPIAGLISKEGYSGLSVPALIETGTLDVLPPEPGAAPPAPDAWRSHLDAYDAAAVGGDRYALVLEGANHFFGGLICWLDQPGPAQSTQLSIASDISRLFLDSYGLSNHAARAVLNARLSSVGPVELSRK